MGTVTDRSLNRQQGRKPSRNPQLVLSATVRAKGTERSATVNGKLTVKTSPQLPCPSLTTRGKSGIGGLCSGGHIVNKHKQPLDAHEPNASTERKKKN